MLRRAGSGKVFVTAISFVGLLMKAVHKPINSEALRQATDLERA